MQPGSTKIIREPMGTVLIIGPYNYPLNLCVAPLAAALSAGCNVVLKPSEQMPAMSDFLAKHLPRYVDSDALTIVLGGIPETTALLDIKFDKVRSGRGEATSGDSVRRVTSLLTPLLVPRPRSSLLGKREKRSDELTRTRALGYSTYAFSLLTPSIQPAL